MSHQEACPPGQNKLRLVVPDLGMLSLVLKICEEKCCKNNLVMRIWRGCKLKNDGNDGKVCR